MPEHYYYGVNFADDPLTPLGTGMFKIENRTTSYIKLVRNDEWWNSTNLPKIEGITINVYLDPTSPIFFRIVFSIVQAVQEKC